VAPQPAAGVSRDQNKGKFTAQLDNYHNAHVYKHLWLSCRNTQGANVSLKKTPKSVF